MKSFFERLFGRRPNQIRTPTEDAPLPRTPQPAPRGAPAVNRHGLFTQFADGEHRFIAIDVETAMRWNGSICQVGFASVDRSGCIRTVGTLIDPECGFDPFNIKIHGITEERVRGAPTFRNAFMDMKPMLANNRLFQHSTFDQKAIAAACDGDGIPQPDLDWNDSIRVARRAWPEFRQDGGYGLANLREKLNLNFRHHDAIEDARAAATVVLMAEQKTGLSFDDLLKPARKSYPKNPTAPANPEGKHFGAVIVFTGSLTMPREKAVKVASGLGFEVKASVTRKTTHLVVGDQDLALLAGHEKSSKHRKAEDLITAGQNISIMGETEFRNMIDR
ncbi:DNA polymerase III subunit epsilon [Thalassovita gelatinovora]|uniref:DNA polymerase III subunit epsilon n=1 Tax=Thalassovita gelatinovora TaxID=53501 RepID=A0A0N7LWB8_THAGE|nr:exonuclease domain-containing protein [Thalassovita gelatinovora]QIZ79056.1 exonuclease [Thalassovita gelatinovora]CUH68658.1 DNA polymerase III subunit epsilon [Thalassovita gelatinovora]SEQ56216.1 DNA polymerase-3 subunit epsilon [Thalassovita gelatinovora]